MRIDFVMYMLFLLGMMAVVSEISIPKMDVQMVNLCKDMIYFSQERAVSLSLPCKTEEGGIYFGGASLSLPITYGVVVYNGHLSTP